MGMKNNVDGSVVSKLVGFFPDNIPERLMQKKPARTEGDFDPNSYFTVLTHLGMKPDYTLDYVYHYTEGFGGNPNLYARPIDSKRLDIFIEYRDWEEKNDLLSFLVADGTPDSFFQLVVFQRIASQFYLFWHANYNDIKVITSHQDLKTIISEVNREREPFGSRMTDEQATGMMAMDLEPTFEVTDDMGAVSYCVFTKWGGLARLKDSFSIKPPHRMVYRAILARVKYDCHVCY